MPAGEICCRVRFGLAVVSALLRRRFSFAGAHRPPVGHVVGTAIAGVGIAAAYDPDVDDFIVDHLAWTGIRYVRVDFSAADEGGPAERLLQKLIGADVKVTLHLMQLPSEARQMPGENAKIAWQAFVIRALDRYGAAVEMIELGSTVNRQRWCGHSLAGFLAMWKIGWQEARARSLRIAGPSITDFEPVWNAGLLSLLAARGLLPDIHTDNLFSERCTEPERFDHKILGHRLASLHKFNLIKKARLLARLGADYGVPRLVSPAAFWTLPRIERVLPDSEQKQADYLARYMLLCAASGALERAWWGPLICHREGLIDNGPRPYPALERITRYAELEGNVAELRVRPALLALRGFVSIIPGAIYEGRLCDAEGLEVHAFRSRDYLIHTVWTTNGRAAALDDIYEARDIATAAFRDRDGKEQGADFGSALIVGESPRYLLWPPDSRVNVRGSAAPIPNVALAAHGEFVRFTFSFRSAGWRGLVHAASLDEFNCLVREIHPASLQAPDRNASLRHARNVIWRVDDPRSSGNFLVVKKPVHMPFYRRLLDGAKPVKALRAWSGACELLRIGVDTARPVAYFEELGDVARTRNFYVCEYVLTDLSIREVFTALSAGATKFRGVSAEAVYSGLAQYARRMHNGGVFFRDMSGGNILVRIDENGEIHFSLIDTGRIRVYPRGVPLLQRLFDLARICNKLHPAGRKQLLEAYFSVMKMPFAWYMRFPFHLYDLKVWIKRKVGRKAIKRWGRKFTRQGER